MSEEIGELFNTITTIYINDRPVQAKLPSALQDSVIRKIDGKYYIEYGILDYIEHLQQKVEQLEKEIDKLNKEYERIYNENCKLRENHNINDITLLDENERLNNIIDTILEFSFFKEECPLNFGFGDEKEEKAQDVFYEDDYCEENCNDIYKKCWMKYFEKLQELKENNK